MEGVFFMSAMLFPFKFQICNQKEMVWIREMYILFYQQDVLIICLKQGMYEITDMYINFITWNVWIKKIKHLVVRVCCFS